MADTIHHEIAIAASPARIYEALLNAEQFAQRTGGAPTTIDRASGGAFSCFGGHVTGRNVELAQDRLIVQAWRAKTWPEGVYSIVRFEFVPDGNGTRLMFDHTGFPDGTRAHLDTGWHENYWATLKKQLEP
ncbi:MAG: SRPBCC domain-containing protein [Flavobacteriales bacterium]